MKKTNKFLTRVITWFDAFSQSGVPDYQLNKDVFPEYQKIKEAHQLLLQEYVRSIATVSRLSFFIGQHEIKPLSEGFLRRLFQLLLFKYSPFKLLYLRPLVQFFVDAHIHKKLSKLSIVYTQTSFLIRKNLPENKEYANWLQETAQECKEFQQTLSSKKALFDFIKFITTSLFVLLLAVAGANSLNEFLQKMILNALPTEVIKFLAFAFIGIIFITPIIYVFWDSTFSAKRTIFIASGLGSEEKKNIYLLENDVFRLLA